MAEITNEELIKKAESIVVECHNSCPCLLTEFMSISTLCL